MKWSTFIGGVDYEPGPHSVTFLAGNTIASFFVSIIDNILFEGNEDLILTINASSLPSHVTINDTLQTTTLIIIDDDGKVVHNYYSICTCLIFSSLWTGYLNDWFLYSNLCNLSM